MSHPDLAGPHPIALLRPLSRSSISDTGQQPPLQRRPLGCDSSVLMTRPLTGSTKSTRLFLHLRNSRRKRGGSLERLATRSRPFLVSKSDSISVRSEPKFGYFQGESPCRGYKPANGL